MDMTRDQVVQLAIETMAGTVPAKYSANSSESLRRAFIEANGGSEKLNMKTFHRGSELFAIIEELLPHVVVEGLQGDEFFMNLVEYRNLAEGDMNEFYTEDQSEFIVADVAHGTQGIRRQRLNAGSKISLTTQLKAVKVYEELRRIMANRVDFNVFVDRVGQAFTKKLREDIYKCFMGITNTTAGLSDTYVITGSYDEDKLLDLIAHVEAATGKTATIYGTKKALRKVTTAVVSHEAETDMYHLGFYGKFNGTNMVSLKQIHAVGSTDFLLDDNTIYVLASDEKPIKVVHEGEGLMIDTASIDNADLTQEYLYGEQYGIGVIFSSVIGKYTIA